jgi:hypothetical protein
MQHDKYTQTTEFEGLQACTVTCPTKEEERKERGRRRSRELETQSGPMTIMGLQRTQRRASEGAGRATESERKGGAEGRGQELLQH